MEIIKCISWGVFGGMFALFMFVLSGSGLSAEVTLLRPVLFYSVVGIAMVISGTVAFVTTNRGGRGQ